MKNTMPYVNHDSSQPASAEAGARSRKAQGGAQAGSLISHRIRIVAIVNADSATAALPPDFEAQGEEHLLRGMERLGRRGIPVGCRGGGCGVCKVQVLAGDYRTIKMSRDCVSSAEEAQGYALACRLYAESDLDIRVVGQMSRAFNRTGLGPSADRDPVSAGNPPAFDMSWRK